MALADSSGDKALSIIVRLKDEASQGLSQLQKSIQRAQKNIEPAADASRKFALGLTAAAASAGAFGLAAIKSAAGMEQTKVAFTTMLGSAEKADMFYKDLVQFAAKTPFELTGLEQASKQLLAYGFSQEQVLPNLKSLGDIAAGVGMDKLPNLILAFGQVKAATHLTGMELRQFTEAGVPLLDQLAQQMGKPVAEIQNMVSAGEIGFPAVQQALESMTGEGGRFNDLMTAQSATLSGMWSNLQDAWEQFLREEGAQLLDWGKQFVAFLIDLVQNKLPPLIEKISTLTQWFNDHKLALIIVAGAITGALVPAVYAMTLSFISAAVALAPFMIAGAIVAGIVAGAYWIYKNWDTVKAGLEKIWNSIKATFISVWDGIANAFKSVINGIIGTVEGWANAVVGAVNTIIKALNKIHVSVPDWVPKYGGKSFGIDLPLAANVSLPRYEHGGIVQGARGEEVPAILHGGEQVIPASGVRGGATIVQVTINNPIVKSREDAHALKDEIDRALRDVIRIHKLQSI